MNIMLYLMVLVLSLFYSGAAAAYLDPGAGSLMLQILVAGIMGLLVTIKLYWYRLKDYLSRLFGNAKDEGPDHDGDNIENKQSHDE